MASCNNSRVLSSGILSKHELFRIVGDQLTSQNVKELVEKHGDVFPGSLRPLVVDGYSFFLALESVGHVDTSDILKLLSLVNRMDLAQFANYRRRKTVEMDPVDQYLEQTAKSCVMLPSWMQRQSPWVRCTLQGKDNVSSSRPGPSSHTPDDSCSTCEPSTSQTPGTLDTSSTTSPTTSKTTASGAKRKRRRGSLTYNKSHNRLKRSRTVECLPTVSQARLSEPTEPTDLSTTEETNRRVTRSRTRSAGVPLSSGSMSVSSETVTRSSVSLPGSDSRVKQSKDCDYAKGKSDDEQQSSSSTSCVDLEEIKKKVTCDIRLRVRAEYCYHDSALDGNIFSNKPELIERQFEKFMQANTILKSRDLGSIICDIKFSELTYLDAFWRDYINGSLLEALKGVFITDSLKQAVGHEAIKLLVNVDEDDYESGRFKLLQNLKD